MGTSPSRSVVGWSAVIAAMVIFASVAGLVDPRVYAQETPNWAIQAKGQDLGNLLAVVLLVVAAFRYGRGSVRAGLVWLGTLLYLVYAFIVYAMAVHFMCCGSVTWCLRFAPVRCRRASPRPVCG